MKRLIVAFVLVLSGIAGPPAHADLNSNPAAETLRDVVPEIAQETASTDEILFSEATESQNPTVRDIGGGEENSEVSLEILDKSGEAVESSGLYVLNNVHDGFSQVIQPLTSGFRVLNIIESVKSQQDFRFKLHVPDNAEIVQVEGAVRVQKGDSILGQLRKPWAFDSDGHEVQTYFSVEGNVVTQHLLTSPETVYPVVSDPNWSYLYVYNLNISHSSAWAKVNRCFNCYFPVTGAPRYFPSYNQLLPLTTTIALWKYNMECRMSYVITATSYYKWQFWATKNHIDGAGSSITFEFRKKTSASSQLIVDAWIINDFQGLGGNAAYMAGAYVNWHNFANNLNTF
jgi:hypothetical protein